MKKSTYLSIISALLLSFMCMAVSAAVVNINKADASALQENLTGVGPVKAKAIIVYRKKNGAFKNISDLKNVPGIGEGLIKSNKGSLSLSKGETKGSGKVNKAATRKASASAKSAKSKASDSAKSAKAKANKPGEKANSAKDDAKKKLKTTAKKKTKLTKDKLKKKAKKKTKKKMNQ